MAGDSLRGGGHVVAADGDAGVLKVIVVDGAGLGDFEQQGRAVAGEAVVDPGLDGQDAAGGELEGLLAVDDIHHALDDEEGLFL